MTTEEPSISDQPCNGTFWLFFFSINKSTLLWTSYRLVLETFNLVRPAAYLLESGTQNFPFKSLPIVHFVRGLACTVVGCLPFLGIYTSPREGNYHLICIAEHMLTRTAASLLACGRCDLIHSAHRGCQVSLLLWLCVILQMSCFHPLRWCDSVEF